MYRIVTTKKGRKLYWTGTMNLSVRQLWAIEFVDKNKAKKIKKKLGEKYKVEKI